MWASHLVIGIYVAWVLIECVAIHRQKALARQSYARAKDTATALGRPLVVVGDPDASLKNAAARDYGCGDICIDLHGCSGCDGATVIKEDLVTATKGMPDDFCVVFESCVLPYVRDRRTAESELARISGGNVFSVGFVEGRIVKYCAPFQHYRYEGQLAKFIGCCVIFYGLFFAPLIYVMLVKNDVRWKKNNFICYP
jgi:hypothetical protein